ncbi:cyclic nucleotide-binding protein [Paraburkholderia sp. Cy-641]|uniref:CBU_0592 family membrane protein n=1 Tax=Paraburkholderia sp. Cy-641 TaxID=2608337 RepID=UPI001422B2BA|nr:cyclic nucleotide-binding protein [Paraburkholderia sp. Cy-641]NIF78060.1 cyclic nucleotide-binding protein [Paraburkholderia sp. Cy-641]
MNTSDLIGIFGVICYQIAYAGLQLDFLQREDRRYVVLNLLGPCCLLYSLIFHFNLAAAVSQVLWLVWSLLGIAKLRLVQR